MATMLYQGHGSYRLTADDGTCVYVDPFAGGGYDVAADVICVTHEHFDHTGVDLMEHAAGCTVVRSGDVHPATGEYVTVETHGLRVTGVEATNDNHPIDECAGMVIEIDGVSFLASGDTSMTDDMRSGKLAALGLDWAVLPADGVYNMGVEEASECAKLIDARHTVPVHMVPMHSPEGATDESLLFSEEKAAAFQAPGKVVLRPGEEVGL